MKTGMRVYNILEVANCHGGSLDYIRQLLRDFERIENVGMKFQPFKYDLIASEDYSYFPVYKKLFFEKHEWNSIFDLAESTHKEIWLDLFDLYGINILKENLDRIRGVKLQASVLSNQELFSALSSFDLSQVKLIINISGYKLQEIEELLRNFDQSFRVAEIIIQVGFQNYPTSSADSGLAKLEVLKDKFPKYPLSIADHISPDSEAALAVPVIASVMGVQYVEKHIRLAVETEFDFQSSLNFTQYARYLSLSEGVNQSLNADFIPKNESLYLKKSLQIPVLEKDMLAGDLIRINNLSFKRTDRSGMNYLDVHQAASSFYLFRDSLKAGSTIKPENLRRARIGSIIACRMKSQRLPQKATKTIHSNLTSLELCIKNTLKFKNIDSIILATSNLEEDQILSSYIFHRDVEFFQGDPDDVIDRFIKAAESKNLDVVIRQTADNCFISDAILQILLANHFKTGADYTTAKKAAIGTNLEIMNVSALKRIKQHFPRADYSEYMTWYFQNNPDYFQLSFVDLPDSLIRDYRLTLDYEEDLTMFNSLLEKAGMGVDVDLEQLFETLDKNPDIAAINKDCAVKYQTDISLINLLNEYTRIKP